MFKFINNKIKINTKKFSAIIGETPSLGARSPILWNRAYKAFNKPYKMYPFDVSKNNLGLLVSVLKKNKNFIGGSVAAPYKEQIIKYLDGVSNEALHIGSVNTLTKVNNKIYGNNTDYYGALYALKKFSKINNILIFGSGGAGKSVILACFNKFTNSKFYFFNRRANTIKKFIKGLKIKQKIKVINNFKELKQVNNLDLIINTTSVGFDSWVKKENRFLNLKYFSPMSDIGKIKNLKDKNEEKFVSENIRLISKNYLETLKILEKNKKASVFDIIYNPKSSQLLHQSKICNMNTSNGLEMNLYQAVKAFMIVNKINNINKIKGAMIQNG